VIIVVMTVMTVQNLDDCEVCSGGTSGHVADSDIDCNGDCFGDAADDSCEVCSGGTSGHVADSDIDCNGDCFGDAADDSCEVCSGGNSGHIANSDDLGCGCFEPGPSGCDNECGSTLGAMQIHAVLYLIRRAYTKSLMKSLTSI